MFDLKTLFIIFIGLIGVALMISCQSDKQDNEAVKEEVISIHDEVMPLMGELKAKQKELLTKAESLASEDSIGYQKEIIAHRAVAEELGEAYEGMFVWMRQFKIDYEGMSDQEVADYLREQKKSITKVNEDIKAALEKAETLQQ